MIIRTVSSPSITWCSVTMPVNRRSWQVIFAIIEFLIAFNYLVTPEFISQNN